MGMEHEWIGTSGHNKKWAVFQHEAQMGLARAQHVTADGMTGRTMPGRAGMSNF